MSDGILSMNVDLIVISQDLEYVPDEGRHIFSQSQGKSEEQVKSEKLIGKVLEQTNGVLSSFSDAIVHLSFFPGRKVSSQPWYCALEIGSDLKINIAAYLYITRDKPKTWKTESINEQAVHTKCAYEYQREGKPVTGDIDMEETIQGYMYGQTKVPYDKSLNMDYDAGGKSFICVGFTERQYVLDEYFTGSSTSLVVPKPDCDSSLKMFATLCKVMLDMDMVIIARRVRQQRAQPKMMALIPNVHPDLGTPYLTMIELIFSENKIDFHFPSLVTAKNKPSDEQLAAIDELIDAMDLMTAEENKREAFAMNKTLNPSVQFVYRAISHRAMDPKMPLPKFSEDLAEMFEVPAGIKKPAEEATKKIKELFPLEEKEKSNHAKWMKKKRNGSDNEPTTADCAVEPIEGETRSRNIQEIGTVTPMEDFDYLFRRGEKFSTLCSQLQNIVADLVFKSMSWAGQNEKISKSLLFYREQSKEIGAHYYNDWVESFKTSLLNRNKTNFWETVIVTEGLGLITSAESETSVKTEEEARDFYKTNTGTTKKSIPDADPNNGDDLFDEM